MTDREIVSENEVDPLSFLQNLPCWGDYTKSKRCAMLRACRALNGIKLDDIRHLPFESLLESLGESVHQKYARDGLSYIVRALGREWNVQTNLKRKRDGVCAPMRHYTLDDKQKALADDMGIQNLTDSGARKLRVGLTLLKAQTMSDLLSVSEEAVISLVGNNEMFGSAVRFVLRIAGRKETFGVGTVRKRLKVDNQEIEVTQGEDKWLSSKDDDTRERYMNLKSSFLAWIVAKFGDTHQFRRVVVERSLRVYRQLPTEAQKNIMEATSEMWMTAIVDCVIEGVESKSSLVSKGRQSRMGSNAKANLPGNHLSSAYVTYMKRFHRFLGLSDSLVPTVLAVQRSVMYRMSSHTIDLAPVHDVLTALEMERVVKAASSKKERLVALLLSRFGMRIGAIQHLRLTGVIDAIVPNERWQIRRYISGVDKYKQINTWDTNFDPAIRDALSIYIEEVWRPKWEQWEKSGSRRNTLRVMWLFPRSWCAGWENKPTSYSTLRDLIQKLLKRAGIRGYHAHPHAFRKGVVTALLKCGNTLHSVSRFVHHKSTSVTEKSYDKRTYEEVVENMQIPLEWEKNHADKPEDSDNDNEPKDQVHVDSAPSERSVGTSSANLLAARALMEEMDANHRLRQENELLLSLLPPEKRQEFQEAIDRIKSVTE
jgi:integrase